MPLFLFLNMPSRSIPSLPAHTRRSGSCTVPAAKPNLVRRTVEKPTNCGTVPATTRSSLSPLITMDGPQETRKKHSRPARLGHKLILVSSRPTHSCQALFILCSANLKKQLKKPKRRLNWPRTLALAMPILVPTLLTSTVWEQPKTLLAELP